jgi:ankyrin repeat protein
LPCIRKLLPISDANHQNGEGDTALIIAAKCCRIDAVRLLAPETDVNLRNKEGRNALMECLDALSKSSSYGGASRGSISNYPLAAMRCALRLLPLTNLEAQAQDSNGETALMKAIGNDSLELFEIILPRSDANLRNANGETALMLADFRTERAFFDLLLPLSDANIQDNKGRTALMRARSDKEAIRVLLTRSNVNAQDNEGFTALMHAADQEWEGVVDLLLPHANVTLKNRAGETAQVLARKCGNTNLANRIRDKEVSQNEHAELQDLIKEPAPNPASGKKTKARGTKWGPG